MAMIPVSKEEFEDVQFDPTLVVVQKEHTSPLQHVTVLYVFETETSKEELYSMIRMISDTGTVFFKHTK
ncbi:putative modifier of suppressor tRNAs [Morganella phage vB_MmoM_Rgz1]|nr:putative modifier of suppressor tRNAs [Morganella phage vB_MmoM_Rgz1]